MSKISDDRFRDSGSVLFLFLAGLSNLTDSAFLCATEKVDSS